MFFFYVCSIYKQELNPFKMTNIRTHLQQQYNKLQTRINKAIKSGKFYQYTAYKQQQLQARLQRYALQLRQLAKGVAVCAALGVALPASAQYVPPGFLMHDGASNPLEVLVDEYLTPVFIQKLSSIFNIPRLTRLVPVIYPSMSTSCILRSLLIC